MQDFTLLEGYKLFHNEDCPYANPNLTHSKAFEIVKQLDYDRFPDSQLISTVLK